MQELRLFKVWKISIHLYCGSHDSGQKIAPKPIFPYYIIENPPISLVHNSVLIGPNNFKFGTVWSYRPYQNLGQIDHNLHSHAFDDVICKPPIQGEQNVNGNIT